MGSQCNITSLVATRVQYIEGTDQQVVRLARTYIDQEPDETQIQRSIFWEWKLDPQCGSGVCSDEPYPPSPPPDWEPIVLPPQQAGDCTINVTFYGFLGNSDGSGNLRPVFRITPAATRAGGGVIVGECNFEPTIIVGGGGDGKEPPETYPDPPYPPGSDPWWKALVAGLAGGTMVTLLNQLLQGQNPTLEAGDFTLTAPCDYTENGDNVSYFFPFPT